MYVRYSAFKEIKLQKRKQSDQTERIRLDRKDQIRQKEKEKLRRQVLDDCAPEFRSSFYSMAGFEIIRMRLDYPCVRIFFTCWISCVLAFSAGT